MRISIAPIMEAMDVSIEPADVVQIRVYSRVDRKFNLAIDCNGITIVRIGPFLNKPEIVEE